MEKHFPDDVEKAEALLSKHSQLKETYQELYASARQDGHKIIDRLKRPVGEGSLPTPFVIGTRHVKEILESLFDERNWLDEQWQRRQLILSQALNLRKYQKEAKKVGGVYCDHMINHMIALVVLSSSLSLLRSTHGCLMLVIRSSPPPMALAVTPVELRLYSRVTTNLRETLMELTPWPVSCLPEGRSCQPVGSATQT